MSIHDEGAVLDYDSLPNLVTTQPSLRVLRGTLTNCFDEFKLAKHKYFYLAKIIDEAAENEVWNNAQVVHPLSLCHDEYLFVHKISIDVVP
jgi:hypothetical protein